MNKLKKTLRIASMILIAIMLGMSGMISASAATITNNGQYSLILYSDPDDWNPNFEGEYGKIVKFNVAGEKQQLKYLSLQKVLHHSMEKMNSLIGKQRKEKKLVMN